MQRHIGWQWPPNGYGHENRSPNKNLKQITIFIGPDHKKYFFDSETK